MLKKLKRSIESMPRPAYIFLKNSLLLCCIMLGACALLTVSAGSGIESYTKLKLALVLLEAPAGILLLALLGFIFILDRS